MVWTVEDGTLIDGANTYIDTEDAISYAADRGITIDSEDIDVLMTKAMDYLETRIYIGDLVDEDQALQQPRDYVYVNGVLQTATQLVARMAKAECEIIISLQQGYDPLAVIERAVKEEAFASFKQVYMDNSVTNSINPKINMWLSPLLVNEGGLQFRIERSYG